MCICTYTCMHAYIRMYVHVLKYDIVKMVNYVGLPNYPSTSIWHICCYYGNKGTVMNMYNP